MPVCKLYGLELGLNAQPRKKRLLSHNQALYLGAAISFVTFAGCPRWFSSRDPGSSEYKSLIKLLNKMSFLPLGVCFFSCLIVLNQM